MRYGVHVSIASGFAGAVHKAKELGCDAFQIFAGNPRGWARKPLPDSEAGRFREALAQSGLGPVVVHLSYLPNPASLDEALYERSKAALREDFERANRLGAAYFVLHPGACPRENRDEGLDRAARALREALAAVEGPTMLLLENQGGRSGEIGADLEELAGLAGGFDAARVGICLDTCHAFVAGYDLRTEAGWRDVLAFLEGRLGPGRLPVIHANDAKGALGSGLDRHEHIGLGALGEGAFAAMGRIPSLADRTVILETPQDDPADDRRNLGRIRALTAGEG